MNNFLKLNNLSKKYKKNKSLKVLNNINFKFESGKVYSIIGPSGSGKSTLLNLLSFIDTPSSGYIEFNKKKIFLIDVLDTPIDFKIPISLVLFLTNIVKPEIILNAATIIIRDKIINITFLSIFKAENNDSFKSAHV